MENIGSTTMTITGETSSDSDSDFLNLYVVGSIYYYTTLYVF